MKRSGPPQRKTPLKPTGPIRPKWPPQTARERRPAPAKRRSQGKMPTAVTEAVKARSRGVCELCAAAPAIHMHHRRLRSQGGRDAVENLAHLCRRCHNDAIHGNPDWAKRHGWIVPSWADPDDVEPVRGCGLGCKIDHVGELS